MDRTRARELHQKLNAAMVAFAKENGLSFVPGRATYGESEFRMKVELTESASTSSGVVSRADRFAVLLPEMAKLYGLQTGTFINGKKLIGFNPKGKKYSWIYETERGAKYKCSDDQAEMYFGKKVA